MVAVDITAKREQWRLRRMLGPIGAQPGPAQKQAQSSREDVRASCRTTSCGQMAISHTRFAEVHAPTLHIGPSARLLVWPISDGAGLLS
jgi:hypothetical protein